jgi:DNA polymerase I-like protein with 3'-5' exonuclease and polymerase domains
MAADVLHPSYLPAGRDVDEGQNGKGIAATGRLASSGPNCLNQTEEVKALYIPDHPDWVFIEFDWSQAELRISAARSGDEAMITALEDDIHGRTKEALGCERRIAKNVLFCSSYGGGSRKVRETLLLGGVDKTESECKALQNALAKAYPRWWQWRKDLVQAVHIQKKAVNPFGRVRKFPMGERDGPAIMNNEPQSTVGDMAWTVFRPLHNETKRHHGRLTTSVYDSFLVQVPKEYEVSMIANGLRILEQTFDEVAPGFKLPVSVSVGAPGASWGDLVENE